MTPFSIQCTTCRRSLRVVDPQAIGQILACPKCGSMVLVEPPPGSGPVGYTGAVAGETTSSPAVKMTAATVTESSQPLKSVGPSSVEDASEAVASSSSSIARRLMSTEVPAMVGAATADDIPANLPGAPIVALAIAERLPEEHAAQAHQWPHWFLPGVLLALAAGLLIFAVRMMAPSSKPEPVNSPAVAAMPSDIASKNAPANPETNSAPEKSPEKTTDQPPQPAPDKTAEQPAPEKQPEVAKSDQPVAAAPESKPPEAAPPADRAQKNPSMSDPFVQLPSEDTAKSAAKPATEPQPPAHPSRLILSPVDNPLASQSAAPTADVAAKPSSVPEPTGPVAAQRTKTLQRVAPRPVNVEARLADPLSGIEVREMPLWAYLDLVSQLSSIPITLDAQAVNDLGQSAAIPVRVKLGETTVAAALEAALEPLRLGYQAHEGQLIVGYPPQENMRQVRYAVGDLTDNEPGAPGLAELAALVRRMVAPDSWLEAGGKASIVAGGDALVVQQNDPAHLAILTFCEKLRVARDKAIKSKFDPARFALTTPLDKAHEILNKPITANFGAPQPLTDVASWLRGKAGVTLLIDHAALAAQGLSADSECTVVADGKPLHAVLDEIAGPLELAWRAVDEKTIEITTPQALVERMDVEFYPVRDRATDAAAGHSLAQRISAKVQPEIWGEDPAKGAIYFDLPGRTLIVRAPQPVQAQVEEFLAAQRKRK